MKRTISYQKTGSYHIDKGLPNQDFIWEAENGEVKIAVIADGVSSCKNSLIGAETVCRAIGERLLDEADYIFASDKKKTATLIVAYIYKVLSAEAKACNEDVESFSSTLSFVCINKINKKILTFNLGDSLIYAVRENSFSLACSPVLFKENRTLTTTTQGVENYVDINIFPSEGYSKFVLCTDGAWQTFYKNGVLQEDVLCVMKSKNMKSIISFFESQNCFDDCSCIVMNI